MEITHGGAAGLRRQRPPGPRGYPAFWIVVDGGGPTLPLSVSLAGGGEALAVFSHEDEASMFCRLRGPEGILRARRTSAREIVSLLYGPHSAARLVALDPLPEDVVGRLAGILTLDRGRFARRFAGSARR